MDTDERDQILQNRNADIFFLQLFYDFVATKSYFANDGYINKDDKVNGDYMFFHVKLMLFLHGNLSFIDQKFIPLDLHEYGNINQRKNFQDDNEEIINRFKLNSLNFFKQNSSNLTEKDLTIIFQKGFEVDSDLVYYATDFYFKISIDANKDYNSLFRLEHNQKNIILSTLSDLMFDKDDVKKKIYEMFEYYNFNRKHERGFTIISKKNEVDVNYKKSLNDFIGYKTNLTTNGIEKLNFSGVTINLLKFFNSGDIKIFAFDFDEENKISNRISNIFIYYNFIEKFL